MEERQRRQCIVNLLNVEGDDSRNIGCWSINENLLYAIFVDQNKMIMISKKKRKKMRIFDQMSHFINSRNSLQCRSHHQKLIEKLGDVKEIVMAFKKYFGVQYYRQQYSIHTGKKARREERQVTSQVKNQDNPLISYCPPILNQHMSQNDSSPQNGACQAQEEEKAVERPSQKIQTNTLPCKIEQPIQYYNNLSYYIGNNTIPYSFFCGFYPIYNSQ